jgi:signal transduction histidine kinase
MLQSEVLSLNSVIVECEKLVRPMIGEDVHLVFVPGSGFDLVKADRGQLGQIIMNLVVNARDAMPHGGTLTIETADVELDEVDARENPEGRPGPYVRLAVRDTGVGMDQETQAQVFEPFFTTKEVGEGTDGLTVYGTAEQSGGFIKSTVNRTRNRVQDLPAEGAHTPELVVATKVAPAQRGTERILVEDEPTLREPVQALEERYQVLVKRC